MYVTKPIAQFLINFFEHKIWQPLFDDLTALRFVKKEI